MSFVVPHSRDWDQEPVYASLPVVTLLKIVAYMDAPHRRAKDLQDIRLLLRWYLHNSDELFSDAVFDAELPDFGLANAFLLGRDIGRLVSSQDTPVVERFIDRVLMDHDLAVDSTFDFGSQLQAFAKGFRG
jgi:predicted nucleotidyltransferase